MEFRQLNHLIAVIEKGSIGKAASSLGISQPAITKSIRNLELALKVKLLERRPNGVLPTVYGDAVFTRSKAVHIELRQLAQEIQELRGGGGGIVKIGVAQGVASRLVPAATIRVAASRPAAKFFVKAGTGNELHAMLLDDDIDFAIAPLGRRLSESKIMEEPLFEDRPVIVVRTGHAIAKRSSVQPRCFKDCRWILAGVKTPLRRMFDQIFISDNIASPVPTIECDSAHYVKSVLTESDFIGFLPRDEIMIEEKSNLLKGIPFKTTVPARQIGILRRRSEVLSPSAMHFIAAIRAVCDEFGY